MRSQHRYAEAHAPGTKPARVDFHGLLHSFKSRKPASEHARLTRTSWHGTRPKLAISSCVARTSGWHLPMPSSLPAKRSRTRCRLAFQKQAHQMQTCTLLALARVLAKPYGKAPANEGTLPVPCVPRNAPAAHPLKPHVRGTSLHAIQKPTNPCPRCTVYASCAYCTTTAQPTVLYRST